MMERRFSRSLAYAAVSTIVAGCANPGPTIDVQMLAREHYAPETIVQILKAPPPGAYKTIARLSMTGAPGSSPAQVTDALQKKAGALGANAIILHDESEHIPSQLQFNPSGGQYEMQPGAVIPSFTAEAIRVPAGSGL